MLSHPMRVVLGLVTCFEQVKCELHDIYQMGYCSVFLSFLAALTYSKESTLHAAAVFPPGFVNEDVWTDLSQPAAWSTASASDLQVWRWEMNVCCCKPVRFWQDYLSKNWWKGYPTIKSPPPTIKRIPENPKHPFIVTEHWLRYKIVLKIVMA